MWTSIPSIDVTEYIKQLSKQTAVYYGIFIDLVTHSWHQMMCGLQIFLAKTKPWDVGSVCILTITCGNFSFQQDYEKPHFLFQLSFESLWMGHFLEVWLVEMGGRL